MSEALNTEVNDFVAASSVNQTVSQILGTSEVYNKEAMDLVIKDLTTTSAKIRALHAANYKRTDIAKHLGIIYQHVRNVLVTPTKKTKQL